LLDTLQRISNRQDKEVRVNASISANWLPRFAFCIALSLVAFGCKPKPVGGHKLRPGAAAPRNTANVMPSRAVHGILGAGATFPYPIYARWAHDYHQKAGLEVNYQSIGSGGGIRQIKAKTVDFGASDAPLKVEELKEAGLVQFPMVMGAVVPAVHLEGLKGLLTLDGATLAGLYLGAIKMWNDPKIAALNPGVTLPATAVTPVYRADGSGTTWLFTNYLSKISPQWQQQVGNDKSVSWPTGVGGKGNEGVAAYVQRVDGSIGYVELAYAVQNALTVAQLVNAAGRAVSASMPSVQAAAATADWIGTPGMGVVLTNATGAEAWPIAGASFILLHKDQIDPAKILAILRFFDDAYKTGAEAARALHYVPMPPAVVEIVESTWTTAITVGGRAVWPPAPAAE